MANPPVERDRRQAALAGTLRGPSASTLGTMNTLPRDPRVPTKIILAINAIGALIFLFVASRFWVESELAGIPGASGGAPIIWFLVTVPIILFFVLSNFGVVAWAFIVRRKRGVWPVSNFIWLSIPIWLSALVIDNLHH